MIGQTVAAAAAADDDDDDDSNTSHQIFADMTLLSAFNLKTLIVYQNVFIGHLVYELSCLVNLDVVVLC